MDYSEARHNMVENQIRANRVTDAGVVAAFGDIPREAFVPEHLAGVAYVDEALALGGGRHVMEPMVLARLLQAAEVSENDVALVIGCGEGYASAVLARLANTVVALESDPELAAKATSTLTEQGIDTVAVVEGPMEDGYPRQAPYDVILFNGAVEEVPEKILKQLGEGGRLVALVSEAGVGRGVLYTRYGGVVSRRDVFDAGTPMLLGFKRAESFVF